MLTVTNKNAFDFVGRYNGIDYHFPQNKTTAIPEDAAKHIFGVGQGDKQDVLVRHGWMQNSGQLQQAMGILSNFSFNVADQLEAGEIIETALPELPPFDTMLANKEEGGILVGSATEETGQGSAPLQTGSGGEDEVPDGAEDEPPQPTSSRGSILETLNRAAGA
jgi:hypothetical protein